MQSSPFWADYGGHEPVCTGFPKWLRSLQTHSPHAEDNQPSATTEPEHGGLHPMARGKGKTRRRWGCSRLGQGLPQGWKGFATSELDESLGMAIPGRNALSSPGQRGKRRCSVAEEKLMVEKVCGSDSFLFFFLKPRQRIGLGGTRQRSAPCHVWGARLRGP